MAATAAQEIVSKMAEDKTARQEIDELLTRSRSISKPSFMVILGSIVQYAEKRLQHQEYLLKTMKQINAM
jgi:hypothetical protein